MIRRVLAVLVAFFSLAIATPALAADPEFKLTSPTTATVGVGIQQAVKIASKNNVGRGIVVTTIPANYTITGTTVLENTTGLTIQCSTSGQVVTCRSNGNMPVNTVFRVGINLTPTATGTAVTSANFTFQFSAVPPVPDLTDTETATVTIS